MSESLLALIFFLAFLGDALGIALLLGFDLLGLVDFLGLEASAIAGIWFALHTLFLVFYLQVAYVGPLSRLRREISRFLTLGRANAKFEEHGPNRDFHFVNSFFSKSLQVLAKFRKEMEEGRVLKSEIELAAEIQKHTLTQTAVEIPDIDIVARTKSASDVGGDSYDVIQRGSNSYVYIGDVTGHGVASGFVMMIVNALISGFSQMLESGAEILTKTNEILKPRVKSNMLMTLLMVRWNRESNALYLTGAGHEYLLLYKRATNAVERVQSGGIALAMTRDISKLIKERKVDFAPGDIAVMYTDGITEAKNWSHPDAIMFGVDRLSETIRTAESKTAQGVFNAITVTLSRFMGYNHRQHDDATLIVMHYRESDDIERPGSELAPEFITEWNW